MPHGQFCWYELMTTDPGAAEPFYRDVVGWTAAAMDNPTTPYTVFSAAGAGVAGMLPLPKDACDAGVTPSWIGYIEVDDVDAYVGKVKDAGGGLHKDAADIPGVGRFAVVADPHGASFVLFKALPNDMPPPPAGSLGTTGWRELHAGKLEEAFPFYAKLFGWTKDEAIPMGPAGIYQLFATAPAAGAAGGMMTKMPQMQGPPMWLYYFNVDSVSSAMERVRSGGGEVLHGPSEVPGGQWIVHALDPQGALFALVAPRN